MDLVNAILKSYVVLRRQGLPAKEALEKLRGKIEDLSASEKGTIVAGVRYYEKHASKQRETQTVPHPERKPIPTHMMTRKLSHDPVLSDDIYRPTTTLMLRFPAQKQVLELSPQKYDRPLIFGRFDQSGGVIPDVDLSDYDGVALGVSRLHMGLTYDERHHQLTIKDMGSANGIFVNGQRLSAYETRTLRNGDRLELGQLMMQVIYAHED